MVSYERNIPSSLRTFLHTLMKDARIYDPRNVRLSQRVLVMDMKMVKSLNASRSKRTGADRQQHLGRYLGVYDMQVCMRHFPRLLLAAYCDKSFFLDGPAGAMVGCHSTLKSVISNIQSASSMDGQTI